MQAEREAARAEFGREMTQAFLDSRGSLAANAIDADLQRAMVLITVLGPCRALEPPQR